MKYLLKVMTSGILVICVITLYSFSDNFGSKQKLGLTAHRKLSNASANAHTLNPDSNKIIRSFFLKNFKQQGDIKVSKVNINHDTLSILSSGWFFYYPLGMFHNLTTLRNRLKLLNFKKEYVPDETSPSGKTPLYRFYNDNSFVKYIYQPDTKNMEIVSGEITDPSIILRNGTKVGMDKTDFLDLYFSRDTHNATKKINVVEFISALDGMWHYYNFKNDKLYSICFDTDYQVDKK